MPDSSPLFAGNMVAGYLYRYGESALVLEAHNDSSPLSAQKKLWALKATLDDFKPGSDKKQVDHKGFHITELVLGNNNLTVVFDPLRQDVVSLDALIKDQWNRLPSGQSTLSGQIQTHQLDAHFGGDFSPDLNAFAQSKSLSAEELVELYCNQNYVVLFLGFQPGFAYLDGLPEQLHAKRLDSPRIKVPAGSIAIGGNQTGIYPSESPGGWQIIGRIDKRHMPLFSFERAQPNLFKPGDLIKFSPADILD